MPDHPLPTGNPAIDELRSLLGERLSRNASLCDQHAHGEDTHPHSLPDAVAFCERADEVAAVLAICNRHGVPVVPFGGGTSLEGHVTPVRGGISLDLSRMNAILAVDAEDMDCRVQPGVTRPQLNEHLRDQGLFFPVDPGAAAATIGGMCATRASGTNAVRYGTIRENVLGLTVALPDGRLITTGGRTRKSSAGYDLTRLFIGSEGTLGVVTEIQLRLHGIPEAMSAATCQFERLADAVAAVIATLQTGVPIARIELLDDAQMAACITYSRLDGLAVLPTLFLEFHGTASAVAEQAAQTRDIMAEFGALGFDWASDADARAKLWQARHDAYWAALASAPGHRGLTTDAVVPISKLSEAILGAKEDIAASGFVAPIVGHVGDGNFHTIILVPPEPGALDRAWALDRKIVARALDLGGSCTGEHGVGIGKREFLEREHGSDAISVMRAIKGAIDPRGIMNPGKIFLN